MTTNRPAPLTLAEPFDFDPNGDLFDAQLLDGTEWIDGASVFGDEIEVEANNAILTARVSL